MYANISTGKEGVVVAGATTPPRRAERDRDARDIFDRLRGRFRIPWRASSLEKAPRERK
jgi:hypothetical protein